MQKWFCLTILAPLSGIIGLGCAGNMRCHFVSTNMSQIAVEPSDARVVPLTCSESYWSVDESDRLIVTGKFEAPSVWDKSLGRRFLISFVLGKPSQGMGKNYTAGRNTVRGYIKTAVNIYRFKSIFGIVGIEDRPDRQIVGAYRINIALQGARFLGGWSRPAPFLLFGTFRALKNDQATAPVRKATEDDGFERQWPSPAARMPTKRIRPRGPLRTKTRPATQPAR